MGFDETLKKKPEDAVKAQPAKKRVMLYLEPKVYDSLKTFAKKRRLSMNVAATLAVEAMLETEDA